MISRENRVMGLNICESLSQLIFPKFSSYKLSAVQRIKTRALNAFLSIDEECLNLLQIVKLHVSTSFYSH